jgi:hypothetical protein
VSARSGRYIPPVYAQESKIHMHSDCEVLGELHSHRNVLHAACSTACGLDMVLLLLFHRGHTNTTRNRATVINCPCHTLACMRSQCGIYGTVCIVCLTTGGWLPHNYPRLTTITLPALSHDLAHAMEPV